ncbi:hypothetical protein F5Y19DRAFT_329608 [Xylariaceae sp. FL1651]|nr:hypothetical protein F5Y19DRAFT_329608 [Xylariaceae sp. FL1651]
MGTIACAQFATGPATVVVPQLRSCLCLVVRFLDIFAWGILYISLCCLRSEIPNSPAFVILSSLFTFSNSLLFYLQ